MNTSLSDHPEKIAKGGTSDLFAFDQNRVVKLLHPRFPRSNAQLEFEITSALATTSIPAPAVFEVVERDGRFGIVFERVDGVSLLQLVEHKPWKLFYAARLLAELHAQVHQYTAPAALPSQRQQLERWLANALDFTADQRCAAEASLLLVPQGTAICHGDFHPGNILLTSRGPVIIDWSTGTQGDPLVDVARTAALFEEANLPPGSPWYMRLLLALARRLLYRTYLDRYFRLRGGTREEILRFLPIQRAATSAWRCTVPD